MQEKKARDSFFVHFFNLRFFRKFLNEFITRCFMKSIDEIARALAAQGLARDGKGWQGMAMGEKGVLYYILYIYIEPLHFLTFAFPFF